MTEGSAVVTYYVVQTFIRQRRALIPDDPFMPLDQAQGQRWFDRLKETTAGAVFFSRTGDPSTGDWDDAVLIDQAGEMPAAFTARAAAA